MSEINKTNIPIENFLTFIRNRLGILVRDYHIDDLKKLILKASEKFNCEPSDYLEILQQCDDTSPLLEHLIAGVTIGETFFFRDARQIALLREKILPKLFEKKREENTLSLRIWSAGCASGEELYTIAMLLCEMLPDLSSWTFHLLGTDINTAVLSKAISGIYGEWSMRAIPELFKKKYFRREKNHYHIDEKICNMATFSWLNLNDDSYPSMFNSTCAQDLILCRNVLIYFDSRHIAKLMKKLDASLVEGGFLMLGASDPISLSDTNLQMVNKESTLYFHTLIPQPIKPEKNQKNVEKLFPTIIPVIAKKSEKSLTNPVTETKKSIPISAPHEEVLALANIGKLEEAAGLCETLLPKYPTSSELYFMLGLIRAETNHLNDALTALRKSIFLDQNFVVGHFQMGLLLFRMQKHEAGLKSLRNAFVIASAKNAREKVRGCDNLDYGHLTEILRNEIELHAKLPEKMV